LTKKCLLALLVPSVKTQECTFGFDNASADRYVLKATSLGGCGTTWNAKLTSAPNVCSRCAASGKSSNDPAAARSPAAARLELTNIQVSFAFDLKTKPNNKDYIVGPDTYCLDIVVAAENAKSLERYVQLTVPAAWQDDEDTMRGSGVGIRVFETRAALEVGDRQSSIFTRPLS
jgi:hypothetical protein